MSKQLCVTHLDAASAVRAVGQTLQKIDARLVDHGERVAYIAGELCSFGRLPLDEKSLFLLCFFHDIGAYKTEEIDRMVEFETSDVLNHSFYGYLFLKHLSPLGDSAEAVLYHHSSWDVLCRSASGYADYAALIHLADRIDIARNLGGHADSSILDNTRGVFRPEYAKLYRDYLASGHDFPALKDGSLHSVTLAKCGEFVSSPGEALEYLKMIVFSIDFRSEFTVTHSINTISISLNIARHFALDDDELEKIYIAALLHDVGKIAIPTEILEHPGSLSNEQMRVMRSHVAETENLIRGVVPDEICDIAIRHHEKLDGSGYPRGLCAEDLSFSQRIVAIADIVSALNSRRSYKEPFPRSKAIGILTEMARAQLDSEICAYVCGCYDDILASTEAEREAVIRQYHSILHEYELLRQSNSF